MAACVLFASVGLWDCSRADATGAEVYLAHHHDAVFASLPNAGARAAVRRELSGAPWLFPDVSGYGSSSDEDAGDDSEAISSLRHADVRGP